MRLVPMHAHACGEELVVGGAGIERAAVEHDRATAGQRSGVGH